LEAGASFRSNPTPTSVITGLESTRDGTIAVRDGTGLRPQTFGVRLYQPRATSVNSRALLMCTHRTSRTPTRRTDHTAHPTTEPFDHGTEKLHASAVTEVREDRPRGRRERYTETEVQSRRRNHPDPPLHTHKSLSLHVPSKTKESLPYESEPPGMPAMRHAPVLHLTPSPDTAPESESAPSA